VGTFTALPGARVLWSLRRRTTDVRCVLYGDLMPVEVHVIQEADVVLTELFQDEWLAQNWARAYSERLRQQGWQDSPEWTQPGEDRDRVSGEDSGANDPQQHGHD
jgi:hypothetical protein